MNNLGLQSETINNHRPPKISPLHDIRTYIVALLIAIPSMSVYGKDIVSLVSHQLSGGDKDSDPSGQVDKKTFNDVAGESIEMYKEQLFKAAVAVALAPIDSLLAIPTGGIPLKYPTSAPTDLPKTIDFYPKKMIVEKLPYTIIRIGEKMFVITPDLGFVVDKMYMDKDKFYVHVTHPVLGIEKEIIKSKESELGAYLAKLYFKGETVNYMLSTVREIPKADQAKELQALKNLNKGKI